MKFLTLYNKSHLLSSSNVRRTYILLFSLTIILITAISCSQSEEETQNITNNITSSIQILLDKKLDLFSSTVNNK